MISSVKTKVLCLLLLISYLFLSAQVAKAVPFEINPLDADTEGLAYAYWLSGPGKLLMIPLRAEVEIIQDLPGRCVLLITHKDFDDMHFAFFAFENRARAGKDLVEYPDDEMPDALSAISSQPETLRFERYGEIAPSVTAVWADEGVEGEAFRHLVVFRDGWVYNAMSQASEGTAVPQDARDFQALLMESVLAGMGPTAKSWTANGLALTVPDAFIVNQPEEGDDDYKFAYICPDETGPLISLCTVYAMRTDMPKSAGLQDLSIAERIALLVSALPADEKITPLDVEGYPGIMSYMAGGLEIYAALHWGVLLLAVELPRDTSQQWEGDFRLAALSTMTGSQPVWPVKAQTDDIGAMEGKTRLISAGDESITLIIPDGYEENVVMDDEDGLILGLESRDGPLFILRIFPLGGPVAPLLTKGTPEYGEMYGALSGMLLVIAQGDAPELELTVALQDDTLLDLPGGSVTDADGNYLMMFCAVGDNLVALSAQADSGPLPEDIRDTMLALLQQEVK